MIRINLLGAPKPKIRAPRITMSAPSVKMLVISLVVIVGAGLYYQYWRLNRQHVQLQADLRDTDKELAALAGVRAIWTQKQQEADLLKHKVDVVEQLRTNQSGPVQLLNMIAETVTTTDAVWLLRMSDEGSSVSMDGMALSTTAVANLITNLRKTGYFKAVELKETVQDERLKEYQAFSFTLICEKQRS
jgi:type IV pilus assembly protein PilN